MTAETIAPPSPADQAKAILRQVTEAHWPTSREAMAAIGYAAGYATECGEIHAGLRYGWTDWTEYDADLMFFGGDPQREAIAIAADKALEAAKAALARLREYERRGELAAILSGTEGGEGA